MAQIERTYSDAAIVAALQTHKSLQFGAPEVINTSVQFGPTGDASVIATLNWPLSAVDAQAILDAAGAAS